MTGATQFFRNLLRNSDTYHSLYWHVSQYGGATKDIDWFLHAEETKASESEFVPDGQNVMPKTQSVLM
jgi:hypothetical protein